MDSVEQIKDRLSKIEWEQDRQEERLNQGAKAFGDVRQSISEINESIHGLNHKVQAAVAPRPVQWTWVAGFAFSVMMAFGGILWTLAQYPNGDTFDEAQNENTSSHKELNREMDHLRSSQAELAIEQRLMLQSQETQEEQLQSIDGKLDQLLLPGGSR